MKKILVVGQTPPPYGGQALMTKRLIEAEFTDIEIIHVRLGFSDNFREVGKASWKKVIQVFHVAGQIWKHRIRNRRVILYYMPAGPNKVPILRDLLLLALVRPFFSKAIYHFRAAGISEFLESRSFLFRNVCKLIYGRPTAAIQLSSLNPPDARFFRAKAIYYVPNGMEDNKSSEQLDISNKNSNHPENVIKILFVGVLREDKGFTWLLNSLYFLKEKGIKNFQLLAMGEFNSQKYEKEIRLKIAKYELNEYIVFLGVKTGSEKWAYFETADFLVFPTFFDCESFGNVLVEAMMFKLPVIASQWRGVPDIVTDEVGFLVPVKNENILAEKIELLINDIELRKQLGNNARKRYLEKYALHHYLNKMQDIFHSIN